MDTTQAIYTASFDCDVDELLRITEAELVYYREDDKKSRLKLQHSHGEDDLLGVFERQVTEEYKRLKQ